MASEYTWGQMAGMTGGAFEPITWLANNPMRAIIIGVVVVGAIFFIWNVVLSTKLNTAIATSGAGYMPDPGIPAKERVENGRRGGSSGRQEYRSHYKDDVSSLLKDSLR
jgi:hypothetical protein